MKKILFIIVGIMLPLVAFSPIQRVSNLERTKESFVVNKSAIPYVSCIPMKESISVLMLTGVASLL